MQKMDEEFLGEPSGQSEQRQRVWEEHNSFPIPGFIICSLSFKNFTIDLVDLSEFFSNTCSFTVQ